MSKSLEELVSIVMPAYRAEAFLKTAIESVQEQTHQEWELIVVDDQSPDRGAEVVSALSKQDARISLIQTPVNGGPSAARRLGIAEARGRYVAFLDSDDIWLPTKLARQIADLREVDGAFSFTAYRRVTHGGERLGRQINVPRTLDHAGLLGNTAIVTSTVLLDTRRIKALAPRPLFHDDFVMWLDVLRGGGMAWGLNEDLVRYRIAEGSYSRRKARMAFHVWRTYREVERLGFIRSAWYFGNYAFRAAFKYASF